MDARTDSRTIPLAVDLDGTLIATDLLWESLFLLIRQNPLYLFMVPVWLAGGKARLKCEIASRVELDPAALPYRPRRIRRVRSLSGAYFSTKLEGRCKTWPEYSEPRESV